MVSQDTPRKVLRIDDVSEPTGAETPPVAAPSFVPNTRNAVKGQMPGAGPSTPEQKFSASYQRALEVKEQARQEMLEAQKMQQVANSIPTPTQIPNQLPLDPPAIVVPQPQQIAQLQSDLNLLVLAGRIEEEVVVGGFKFKMSTLTSGEQDDFLIALSLVSTKDDLVKLGQLRLQILARSIRTVNGVPLEQLYQGVGATNPIDKKVEFLRSTQMSLTIKLFDIYQEMLARSEKVFTTIEKDGDLLKN